MPPSKGFNNMREGRFFFNHKAFIWNIRIWGLLLLAWEMPYRRNTNEKLSPYHLLGLNKNARNVKLIFEDFYKEFFHHKVYIFTNVANISIFLYKYSSSSSTSSTVTSIPVMAEAGTATRP